LVLTFIKNTDTIYGLLSTVIDLSVGDVQKGLESICKERVELYKDQGLVPPPLTLPAEMINILGNVVSLVLYLCTVDADYERVEVPSPTRTKKGPKFYKIVRDSNRGTDCRYV